MGSSALGVDLLLDRSSLNWVAWSLFLYRLFDPSAKSMILVDSKREAVLQGECLAV